MQATLISLLASCDLACDTADFILITIASLLFIIIRPKNIQTISCGQIHHDQETLMPFISFTRQFSKVLAYIYVIMSFLDLRSSENSVSHTLSALKPVVLRLHHVYIKQTTRSLVSMV